MWHPFVFTARKHWYRCEDRGGRDALRITKDYKQERAGSTRRISHCIKGKSHRCCALLLRVAYTGVNYCRTAIRTREWRCPRYDICSATSNICLLSCCHKTYPLDFYQFTKAYNGEIFGGEYYDTSGACSSDTPVFAHVIHTAIQTTIARKIDDYGRSIVDDSSQAVAEALAKVEGPYAFIYFSRQLECFIFGRDPFGRRSLISISKEGRLLALTSGRLLCKES